LTKNSTETDDKIWHIILLRGNFHSQIRQWRRLQTCKWGEVGVGVGWDTTKSIVAFENICTYTLSVSVLFLLTDTCEPVHAGGS
jgi:hypothetical protein